jgi:hypothetical protein
MPSGGVAKGWVVIYKRGKSWRVIVYIGRDPMTGKQLRKGASAPTRGEAKLLEPGWSPRPPPASSEATTVVHNSHDCRPPNPK